MRIGYSAEATTDLDDIFLYMAGDSVSSAQRVMDQLTTACDSLADLPHRDRPGREPGTRELTSVWPYVIVYRVLRGRVEIAHIHHGARLR